MPDLSGISPDGSAIQLLIAVPLCIAAGWLVGWLLGRRPLGRLAAGKRTAEERLARLETQVKEQKKAAVHQEQGRDTVANLALSLPHIVRELNRDDLDSSKIPDLILTLADSIFQPRQMLLYLAANPAEGGGKRRLFLKAQKGLGELPEMIRCIEFGDGKLGWVAEHRLDRLHEDWRSLSRTDGMTVRDNHPSLHLDIVGPLTHHTFEGEQVLGVLSVGQPSLHPQNEKLMFQMVTNLGSLALVNARNVSRLREQANHDGLTGLLTKRYFLHRLSELMLNHSREAQRLALFIFDIDHFKTYNDTNGHPAGDQLLRGLAELLKQAVRPGDWCCRYGGEEFMIAMPQTDAEEGISLADRIRGTIEAHDFEHQEKQPNGNLTISGGVAVYPKDGNNLEELIQHADEALYQSKHGGRNRVTRYRGVEIGEFEQEMDVDLFPAHGER